MLRHPIEDPDERARLWRDQFTHDHAPLSPAMKRALKWLVQHPSWYHYKTLRRVAGIRENTLDAMADKRIVRYRYTHQLTLRHVQPSRAKYWQSRKARLTAYGVQLAKDLEALEVYQELKDARKY